VKESAYIRQHGAVRGALYRSEPDPTEVIPFGSYGVGTLTGHPVGLVVVFGLLLMGWLGIPEARWFLAAGVGLGAIFGLFLWLRHR
jgi:hypothetical protein